MFISTIRKVQKCDLCDFDHGVIVSVRCANLSIFLSLLISRDFHIHHSLELIQTGAIKKKHPACISSVDGNAFGESENGQTDSS